MPTVCANTTCRPNPTSRASTVMTPIITAARPMPCPRLPALAAEPRCARPSRRITAPVGPRSSQDRKAMPRTSAAFSVTAAPVASRRAAPRRGHRHRGGDRGRRRRGGRAAAEHVQPVQRRRGRDDLGEADLLARHGERGDPGEQAEPGGPRQRPAAAAPSIAPSAFAPASPSMARSARSSGSSASAAPAAPRRPPGPPCARCRRPCPGGLPCPGRRGRLPRSGGRQRRDLDSPAWAQVEEVEQVRAARDEAGVDRHVRRARRPRAARRPGPTRPGPPA